MTGSCFTYRMNVARRLDGAIVLTPHKNVKNGNAAGCRVSDMKAQDAHAHLKGCRVLSLLNRIIIISEIPF